MSRLRAGDQVFINCPFDARYRPLFEATVFAVHHSGFEARCSLEADNAGQNRLARIMDIIAQCRFGIHDISRTQLNRHRLPRFNMPLELGIFLGCHRFGGPARRKSVLIVDRDRYRYQQFISDIAGQDVHAHANRPHRMIEVVRNWLRAESGRATLPGANHTIRRYDRFCRERNAICRRLQLKLAELTFVDFSHVVTTWLAENA